MHNFVFACLSLAILGLCTADGSPVYQPPVYSADQPVYSPDTAVSYSPSSVSPSVLPSAAPSTVDPVGYHSEGYADNYPSYPGYDVGYGIQNGYEGYLVPSHYGQLAAESEIGPMTYLWSLMPYPSTVLHYVGKIVVYAAAGASIAAIGVLAVLAICTFTPFCTISFNGLDAHHLKEEVRTFMTPDRISAAVRFFREAVTKYRNMQDRPVSKRR